MLCVQLENCQNFRMPGGHVQAFSFMDGICFVLIDHTVLKSLGDDLVYCPALSGCIHTHGVQLNIVE